MSTLHAVELGVLGPLQVRRDGAPVMIPGAKPRAILTMLGLHGGSVVSAETLLELLWGDDPPRTAAKALQTHISALRRTLDEGFVLTEGTGWLLTTSETDASRYRLATRAGRDAAAAGDTSQAVARFEEALTLWRGTPELPDTRRGISEKTRWIEGHAALVEDRADALLATGRAAEIIGELEAAVADAPLRERRWGQLMLALYRAGRQGEALAAYQRARSLLAEELGIDPGSELRRLEAAIVSQDTALDMPVAQNLSTMTRAVTFLLTDIEGSTAAWEAQADAMAIALARHDELVEQVVTSRGGRLIKTRGEGDATFSVFDRPSGAAAAAIELQEAIGHEPWALREPMRIRIALHTGEVELRDGDYFGRAVNRAARLRSLAVGGQILCSGATAELVIDSLPDDVLLADLGMRQLKNLARPEHVFELRLETTDEGADEQTTDTPIERPSLPAILTGPGPFVGRGHELEGLLSAWQTALTGGMHAVLIAGEPGVGKTRLAGEWSQQAYEQGAVVLYGRCDEDLGAPYQPFAEALRSLVPCIGATRLRGLRGVEALLALVPGLTDVLPDLAAPTRADPETERYALFDAAVALLEAASGSAPVVLILDDLHWAAKPTLLLLRHLLRFGDHARVQIVGTYRSTDLDRSHPLAAMLADLHRDGTANRLQLSGLDEDDVTEYVTEAGYDDEELARALASVTGGNPFFLIEALRHVDESGGIWDPSTLPQGVRETVSRRLSRLSAETNKALAAAAVVGSRFDVDLVEGVVEQDLVDAFDEACKAGIIIEEPGGRYRFNHAIVRQSLLAELASVRRMRLHQRIAATLETQAGADDELLAELAYHYFECAWAGNAAKAVEYCRRAADQAMARLGYEGAAELYDRALHALEELDEELPDRDDQAAELLIARCEALLAAGDVTSAAGAVSQLQAATVDSARLTAWATCFDGQLSMLIHPERLDEAETALAGAAEKLAELDDAAGEATAHTVRAGCLARLGRIADCEIALDEALTAARRAREHRRVNDVLAGAPLAALWGPNPVPRAGGRCLDVVRLLRITTDSPAVEATSTRCQAVLEAFRGRGAAARRMIDSARRTLTELGLRHALLEVEQFAGIVELVIDDPAAAEPHLRKAYNGFRRMGLDADTAETAALLGRTCLALNRDAEADELCTESERLAGHALKPSIAWRTLRARLLSRDNNHDGARRVAEAAVSIAERTDALVDHGDACLTLATILGAAGDVAGARAAAERAVDLYERKGAAALAERARLVLGQRDMPSAAAPPEAPAVELDTAAVRAGERVMAAVDREDWDEFERLFAPGGSVESRRKVVGFKQTEFTSDEVMHQTRRDLETGALRINRVVIAVRGERLALARAVLSTADVSPGAPRDEFLQLYGIDEQERIALQIWFDVEDLDAAIAELDAMHARFEEEQPQPRRLENAANRVAERYLVHFAARNWDAMTDTLADDFSTDDRRRVVNAGIRLGRGPEIANMRATAEVGVKSMTSTAIAIRGERLALTSFLSSANFPAEVLVIVEIDAENQISALVVFEPDDFDAAIAELDARYIAGEAAPYAHAWSVIKETYAAANRLELEAYPTAPDLMTIDHRGESAFGVDEIFAYLRAGRGANQNTTTYIEAVHRLNNNGAVITYAAHETSPEGFEAEWRGITVLTVEGDLVDRCEVFGETDLDAAIGRFDELNRPTRRLENAASRAYERLWRYFAARDWVAVADTIERDISDDDRRRVVNSGLRHGRDALIANLRAVADGGTANVTPVVIATRGERLVLASVRLSSGGERPDAFYNEVLRIIEINSDERIAAAVMFGLDDLNAAFAELDRRYLAGEAADHARTWSVIAGVFAAHNRREIAAATPDVVSIDHRRVASFAPGEGLEYIHAGWDLDQTDNLYIETAHRLDDLGAVFTWAGHGTSHEGFEAEWRGVEIITVDGDLVSRAEVFDEADLDAALARFDELCQPARRLENAASRTYGRFQRYFAGSNWDALTEMLADNFSQDDRRRVVGAGLRRGRDAQMADIHAFADIGANKSTATVIATRGERLVLCRSCISGEDQQPGASRIEFLSVVEITADERIAARNAFDLNDIDAAIAELDDRYLAGEAAPYAHTWSVITRAYAAGNRNELPVTTPDWASIDHRRGRAFEPGELATYMHATWDVIPDTNVYVESVHRLSNLGAVVTHAVNGTSRDGFDADWREIAVTMVDGDRLSRTELFDEGDLDAAIARFEELSPQTRQLENAASQAYERFRRYFAARDWAAMADLLTADTSVDDHRRVVNAEIRRGREVEIANMQAFADLGANKSTATVIATRAERLVLCRTCITGEDQQPGASRIEFLCVVEITADERIAARTAFDLDDFDAAVAHLDARYLAGEAAAHAHTWSAILGGYARFSRHELPSMTPDSKYVDHRRVHRIEEIEAVDLAAAARSTWDMVPDVKMYVEAVHRLNDLGAVVTHAVEGTSPEGFDAAWRVLELFTFDGDRQSRFEIFDESDLDAALARFDELHLQAPRLENTASQVAEHFLAHIAARDWDAITEVLADGYYSDDRRRAVGAGLRRGRESNIAEIQMTADLGVEVITRQSIATRGERLVLSRVRWSASDEVAGGFHTEVLGIVELDTDERIAAIITVDHDDIDAAFTELDARYLAGEAAPYARTWSAMTGLYAGFVRHELPPMTPDSVLVDHRPGQRIEAADFATMARSVWDTTPHIRMCIDAVHRLSELGAVVTLTGEGTTPEGFKAEWRMIEVVTLDTDRINRLEIFDEADLDTALTRFEELHPQTRRPENAASRAVQQFLAHFVDRDWDDMAELLADDFSANDRRRVANAGVRRGRDAEMANWHATADLWSTTVASTVIAARKERLALFRFAFVSQDQPIEAFQAEALTVVEINDDNRVAAVVVFDPGEIDAAFAELDARYLAGEAAPYARTWSVIAGTYVRFNQHEVPAMTPNSVSIDHRHLVTSAVDLAAFLRATWELMPDVEIYIEAVHRLSEVGAVLTHTAYGISQDGFDAEWRMLLLLTVDGDLISRCEIFDEADLDAALARFEELHPRSPRLENAVMERALAHLAARDWDAVAQDFAENYYCDDRRRVVNAGLRQGRDAAIEDLWVSADIGTMANIMVDIIATRGERRILTHWHATGPDPGAVQVDVLQVIEHDDERFATAVLFDPEDIDAAIEELDARYLADEAAPYAQTWSLLIRSYAALNRREIPATTQDWVNIDHRRALAFTPGEAFAYIRASWDVTPDLAFHIETVHRLSKLGAVVTHGVHGTSREGFDAEWRNVSLFTFDGELINCFEVFDEADLDAALTRFDELQLQVPRVENAATQVEQRFNICFAARDWAAMAELLSDDILMDDRRRIVNGGVRRGRDAEIANERAVADVGVTKYTPTVIAVRGERLALSGYSISDGWSGSKVLGVSEINAESQIVARIVFDPDDIDAAFEELDSRYLAGEAAPYAQTWSVIAAGYAALNRREQSPTTPDYVQIDHRLRATVEVDDLGSYLRATWELVPELTSYLEAVHRLSDQGAVVTHVGTGTSQDGFDAEWREIDVLTIQGDLFSRCEIFDEGDLDAALARFDELQLQTRRLENAASQVLQRFDTYFAARDLDAMADLFADDIATYDRRRIVNAGDLQGRDAQLANMRALTELEMNTMSTVIATRGERLVLTRLCSSNRDLVHGEFGIETLNVAEIDGNNRIVAGYTFDADEIDAAFEELDARYLAGEAAPYAQTWSVIAQTYAAFNRREFPSTTPDSVYVDHRPLLTSDASDLAANIRVTWDLMPDACIYIVESVHRLTELGAVVTQTLKGASKEGLDVEYRMIDIFTVERGLLSRCEIFDEENIDAALARFEELQTRAHRLENAASRTYARLWKRFMARDWANLAETIAHDIVDEDGRRLVGHGIRRGRDAEMENLRVTAELGLTSVTPTVIATRGERLALHRVLLSGLDQQPGAFFNPVLRVVGTDADERIVVAVLFDIDDLDAAFKELDARYLISEAAPYAQTWSVVAEVQERFNRQELPSTTPNPVYIDHRPLVSIEGADLAASIRAVWDITSTSNVYIEAVHQLSELGAVFTQVLKMTSREGFDAELRLLYIFIVEGDLISGVEVFEEADLDVALARFEELQTQAHLLENAATRAEDRFFAYYKAHNWAAVAEILADDSFIDNRTPVVSTGLWEGRDVVVANMQALADSVVNSTSAVVAIRGERLALARHRFPNHDARYGEFVTEQLIIAEIDTDDRIAAHVVVDPDDMDAAITELDGRYLAGEAAAYAHTWSVITSGYATLNRHEVPPTTADLVSIDHRRGIAFAPGEFARYARATFDVAPDIAIHIEVVHRLSTFGIVLTHVGKGTSSEGFEAAWRETVLLTVDGDAVNRCEMFDEKDLEAALTRFGELDRPAPRLENAATRTWARSIDAFNRRAMDDYLALMATDGRLEDRRKGLRGLFDGSARRKAVHALFEEPPESWRMSTEPIAVRGSRLALTHECCRDTDAPNQPITVEVLTVVEVDDDLICYTVSFDPDDIDAAFEELEARYLAGEAAAHSHAWSLIAQNYAAFNRHELPATTPDWVMVDHRRLFTSETVDLDASVRALWDLIPSISIYIEVVHRLSELGAVVTQTFKGISQEGFDAEWRLIDIYTVEGDLLSRSEVFDEADIEAALARFDELDRPTPSFGNAATRARVRTANAVNLRDVDGVLALNAVDARYDDRRKGLRDERAVGPEVVRAIFEAPRAWQLEVAPIAIRGSRLALTRDKYYDTDDVHRAVTAEHLMLTEVGANGLLRNSVLFDPDDLDAAFEELDARYLAGEAAAYARTWAVIMQAYSAANRHEIAATSPNLVNIDHRRLAMVEPGNLIAYLRNTFDDLTDISTYLETVHRLTDIGAVFTHVGTGTSEEGFHAEWRMISVTIVEDNLISRCEMFDEEDLEAALARFDELDQPAPLLENASTRTWAHLVDAYNRRDMSGFLALMTEDARLDDRRKGLRGIHDGLALWKNVQQLFQAHISWRLSMETIAIRGSRLSLTRHCIRDTNEADQPITWEALAVMEVGDGDLMRDAVSFDPDNINDALDELTARWIASGGVAHPEVIEAQGRLVAATNRHDWDALAEIGASATYVSHRQLADGGTGTMAEQMSSIRTMASLVPDLWLEPAEILTHSAFGLVTHMVEKGTSTEGVAIELPFVILILFDGDRVTRVEAFDLDQRNLALARFEEIGRPD
ncbi:MAG: BTAD domain-containing putative transcriptional regulator [Mycobacterium sp.]|uniref:BTAD domain-containing putative transcriptional regulator n=1 Tax=Mycobacterium sp. TaxID=1785 RepID=UPI003C633881